MINVTLVLIVAVVVLVLIFAGGFVAKRRPAKLDQNHFKAKWQELQGLCKDSSTWPLAVINADKLVDEALKKCRYKGKTMGERLVAAQHDLSSNDTIWFGHKLRNKLVHEDYNIRNQKEVKDALLGFLQALKDVGAMK